MWRREPLTLYCRRCATGYICQGKVPPCCPHCHQTAHWTTSLEPRVDWVLTEADTTFLRINKIAPA